MPAFEGPPVLVARPRNPTHFLQPDPYRTYRPPKTGHSCDPEESSLVGRSAPGCVCVFAQLLFGVLNHFCKNTGYFTRLCLLRALADFKYTLVLNGV